jgi:hypothetical protein
VHRAKPHPLCAIVMLIAGTAAHSCILRLAWIDISTPKPTSSDTAEVPP